ncbi:leucine-rich repeat-containing protein 69 isoform X1 [Mus musculus]|nr:leucine-rich repeat-containing protein 69 isoform X1 [Mus musculus]XP_030109692.1 leucine-rich repeat-containing protein 69 isoform X1 [Mus musculus]|eukprot:XP_006538358.1 PREDICTED: leucine-rich repeat-containing protein 69 isoform X1 [Mus musculus]
MCDRTILRLHILKIYNNSSSIMVTSSKIMAERLLVTALKGGKNTKILTLNGKRITKMPSTLEKLPNLKTLDLQNNSISKVCPELRTLTQLTLLNLGNNHLQEVPEEIKYLTSLKNLHLFGNRICRIAPGVFNGLHRLIMLNLNDNRLTSLPQEIGRLRSLTYLSLNRNNLTVIPKELCSLEHLSELHLNYNQIVYIPEEIKFLKNLQQLFLVRNNIEELPEEICHLEKLRVLDIAGNVIQIFPAGFQNLRLTEFYCEGNPLFLKRPFFAVQPKDLWTLREIAARFVLSLLEENDPLIMNVIESYPEVKDKLSKAKKCSICRKPFLTEWLECVYFVAPSKNWKISRNLKLIPVQTSVCSYQCFDQRDPDVFGIAQE